MSLKLYFGGLSVYCYWTYPKVVTILNLSATDTIFIWKIKSLYSIR